jgi:hypothetical protein
MTAALVENPRRAFDPFAPHHTTAIIDPPALIPLRDPADVESVRRLLAGAPAGVESVRALLAATKPAAKRTRHKTAAVPKTTAARKPRARKPKES